MDCAEAFGPVFLEWWTQLDVWLITCRMGHSNLPQSLLPSSPCIHLPNGFQSLWRSSGPSLEDSSFADPILTLALFPAVLRIPVGPCPPPTFTAFRNG